MCVRQILGQGVGLFQCCGLRLFNQVDIAFIFTGWRCRRLSPDQLPCGIDDLLLQLGQLLRLIAVLGLLLLLLLLLLLRFVRWLLSLPKDLLEVTHFCEVHVAERPTRLTIRSRVLGPKMVGEQLIGFGLECFEADGVREIESLLTGNRLRQHHIVRRGACHFIGQPNGVDTVIVPDVGF